jgi:hypothetical protein
MLTRKHTPRNEPLVRVESQKVPGGISYWLLAAAISADMGMSPFVHSNVAPIGEMEQWLSRRFSQVKKLGVEIRNQKDSEP